MSTSIILSAVLGILALGSASWKWQLPARRSALIIAFSTLVAVGLVQWQNIVSADLFRAILLWIIQGGGYVAVIMWLFYRDPERRVPDTAGVIVSPADGTVLYVRQLEAGEPLRSTKNGSSMLLDELRDTEIARQPLWQIGISMVFTDVHVNRAPIKGAVALLHHRPGKFLSLRDKDALGVNERQTIVIGDGAAQIALVQIASRLVRQIVAYVSPGESLARGQRIGMIRFGSQVDLFVPVALASRLDVVVGQRTTAGETVICRMHA